MKVITRLDVSCLYKKPGKASAIFSVSHRRGTGREENGESATRRKLKKKKKNYYDKKQTISIL